MAFPFKSEGFWGPLFRRRNRPKAADDASRAKRPTKRQLVMRLKAKTDRMLYRDRLIFDPLEPRVLLNSDITYTVPSDPPTQEHQLLVKLVQETQGANQSATPIQRIQILDFTNGQEGAVLHSFGDVATSGTFTIVGLAGKKDVITVDVDSFNILPDSRRPMLAVSDTSASDDDGVVLRNGASALFALTGTDAGTISSGKFTGSFSGVANLSGASGASDTLVIGANGQLSGIFSGGKGSLQLDLSNTVSGDLDATLSDRTGGYAIGSSAATFASLAFTAPTTNFGVILGSGNDTLHLATLPPGTSFGVTGGAGNDALVFDANLPAASGGLTVSFDGGAGDDRIDLSTNLTAQAGDIGFTFHGGAGDNSLVVAQGKTITASGAVTFTTDATVTPALVTSGDNRGVTADARMGVTINQDAIIRGASVAISVRSSITVSDTAPINTQTLSVSTTGGARITLDGTVTATTGAADLTTDVENGVTLRSALSSQLKRITPTQTNISTIAVGARGAVNGGTIKLAATTRATVDVKAVGLVLPGAGTFTDTAKRTGDTLKGIVTGESSLSDVFTPAELAVEGVIKKAETSVTNTTQVTVDKDARLTQTGTATLPGTDPAIAVQLAASDTTNVTTKLVAADNASIPILSDILNLFALTGNQTVTRTTSVDVGVAANGTLPAAAPLETDPAVITAAGGVALQAANSGKLLVKIGAATEAPDDPVNPTKALAGDGEEDGSLAAPVKAGAALITANDTVRVAVRGVAVTGASLLAVATNSTEIEARAIQARNLLTGATSATAEKARLTAGTGSITITAMDATVARAIAVPTDITTLDEQVDSAVVSQGAVAIGRGSAINTVQRDVTATVTDSVVTGETGVTLTAENALDLTTTAQASSAPSKFGVAGSLAVNVVLGSTTATVTRGSVTAVTGDVTVSAGDVSKIDSRVETTVEGGSKGGGTAIGGAAAFNVVGYGLTGIATSAIADKIVGTALDAVLGTGFFTVLATQSILARISAANVTATTGAVGVNAASAGTVNATVSNTVTVRTPEQNAAAAIKNRDKGVAIDKARQLAGKTPLKTVAGSGTTTSAGSRSFGGLISTNRMARAATAEIVSASTITAGGEVGARAADTSTINANVKLVSSGQASSDGGLKKQAQIQSDYQAGSATPVAIKLGQRVALSFPSAIPTIPVLDKVKGALPTSTNAAQSGQKPAASPATRVIQPGSVVLVSEGHPVAKGEVGSYYRYVPATASAALNLATTDFTVAGTWQKIGPKDAVYAWTGADKAAADLDLRTANYSDLDLWRRVGDGEGAVSGKGAAKAGGSGATAAGGIVVRNEIRGGASASIAGSTVTAGSVAVSAERAATITAKADATVEAIATLKEQTGTDANGDAGAGTASSVPGQTSAFDKPAGANAQNTRSTALAINGVIATNTILSTAEARIADASITTRGGDGSVSVSAKTEGSIEATVAAQITAAS
ncbi:LEPR-XLL domain-containing protein, partial [Methylobacterium segetis]|uniref:LEPR-XLL domain-containing protein n=1 Tax=Methylobacterium segetis TaxID=2488750 RepID=UPI0010507022